MENHLKYQGILCVPNVDGLRVWILEEAHGSRYSIHPWLTKMYHHLREIYWWEGLKRDIAEFVSKCPNCQQVKVEHLKSGGLLQEIQIQTWKWEDINMYFVVSITRTQKSYDSIWVVVDQLTKSARFITVNCSYSVEYYAIIFLDETVCLHGIPYPSYRIRAHNLHLDFRGHSKKG